MERKHLDNGLGIWREPEVPSPLMKSIGIQESKLTKLRCSVLNLHFSGQGLVADEWTVLNALHTHCSELVKTWRVQRTICEARCLIEIMTREP